MYAWARYLSSTLCWVVYFGSWNGLPKHAVHRVYIWKIFARLQVRKLQLKHLNASELIVSMSTYVEIAFNIWWQSMTKPLRTSGGHRWQSAPYKKFWVGSFGPSTICTLLPSSEVHPQIPMVTIPECQRRAMSQKSWWAYTRSWLPRNILYMLIWQATKNILL